MNFAIFHCPYQSPINKATNYCTRQHNVAIIRQVFPIGRIVTKENSVWSFNSGIEPGGRGGGLREGAHKLAHKFLKISMHCRHFQA